MDWPVVSIHTHLLPNGRILTWGHSNDPVAWDPATGSFQAAPNPIDIFCGGHALLPDGQLLVTGGNISGDHGLPNANLFDYATGTWTAGPQMAHGRWYPTNTALPNGEMLVTSGEDENGLPNPIPEVWQHDGTWRQLSTASMSMGYYPWMFVAPDGRVFYAGWEVSSRWLDPSGTGAWSPGPGHIEKFSRVYGTAVMYDVGKILVAGGADNPPVATTEVIDLNSPSPKWRRSTPMIHARHHAVATSLPDGTVLVSGGSSSAGVNDAAGAVLAPEVWDPATETWKELTPMTVKRLYHSSAVLMADARVFVAGGGQPHADGEVDNFNAQIFSPPYLFNADGSPADRLHITDAPAELSYGGQFSIATPSGASVTRVNLLKLGSMTHAFNQSQRFIRLSFSAAADGSLSAVAPADANVAQPGYYMLFLIASNGAPSVARIVHIQ